MLLNKSIKKLLCVCVCVLMVCPPQCVHVRSVKATKICGSVRICVQLIIKLYHESKRLFRTVGERRIVLGNSASHLG